MDNAGKNGPGATRDELFRLGDEAEKLVDYMQKLSAQELVSETGALMLRLKRLEAAFGACEKRMQDPPDSPEPDPAIEAQRLQLAASAAAEQRWVSALLETLQESRRSLELSDTMKKKAFDARLSAALEGRKDL